MPTNRFVPIAGVVALFPLLALAQDPATQPPAVGTAPAAAAPAPKADEPPPTEAEALLDEAIKKVAAVRSVSADISQDVDMLGQQFRLEGQYLRGPDYRLYFRLTLSGLGDAKGVMLQVCDGTTMWDFQQVLSGKRYTKFDIGPVLKELQAPEVEDDLRERIVASLGFAGPDALLIGLRRTIRFDQKDEEEFQGKKVWVIRGSWKDREGLTGPNNQPLPPTAPLPAYIPSLATLRIGQEDGWPYQVKLSGKAPTMMAEPPRTDPATGRAIGPTSAMEPSEITITYSNVKLDPELPPENFAFQAEPGASVQDTTQDLVRQLQAAGQMAAAQKKQAAQQATAPPLPGLPAAPSGFGPAPAPGVPGQP